MTTQKPLPSLTVKAGGAITQYALCKLSATGRPPTVVITTDDTSLPFCIAQEDVTAAQATAGFYLEALPIGAGTAKVIVGGANAGVITAGDRVCPDGADDGKVKTAASGDVAFGIAMQTSSAEDDIIEVQLTGVTLLA